MATEESHLTAGAEAAGIGNDSQPAMGSRVPALNSRALVAGRGIYVGDITLPGMLHMALVRSMYAHALIKSIDTKAAEAVPGVVCVVTGEEIRHNTKPIPQPYNKAGIGVRAYDWYALAHDKVRYVGEAVAVVVAEDKYTAHKAAELVEVDYEELPVIADAEQGMAPGAPLIEPAWGTNLVMERVSETGDLASAFGGADGVIKGCLSTQRYSASPMEPRGYAANYDSFRDQLTMWASTQCPHPLRTYIAHILGTEESRVRVIQPNVGGAFGSKIPTYQEEPLTAYLARKLGRPVKWIEERSENLLTGGHAREQKVHFEAAYKRDGQVIGLKAKIVADVGAPAALAGWEMSLVTTFCIPTVYKIPNCRVELYPVATNKCPWNAYRGFGKETASFLMDRIMDGVAQATGLDRAAVRMRNYIQPHEFPYQQVSGVILDSGNYPGAMRKLLDLVGYADFPRLQAEALREGRRIGLGLGQELVAEGCSLPTSLLVAGYDGATVRVNPSGQVTVLTGVTSPGSGNETAIAQVAADTLGVDVNTVRVIQGDTETCPWGLGNYSSRAVIMGGSATFVAANDIKEKILKVAGHMLEVLPADLDCRDGKIFPKDAPARYVSFNEVVHTIYNDTFGIHVKEIEPGLEATRYFRHPNIYQEGDPHGRSSAYPSWPNAVVGAIVEVDPADGKLKLLRVCMVHDSGVVVNPMLAEGNVHGGIAQGIGGAIYEHLVYDENGQFKTGTFMDYTLPTAVEIPPLELAHQETRSPFTPLGTKGVGESGVLGILGAICGAVENALPELDLRLLEMPLAPERLLRAIQTAPKRATNDGGSAR
jgi:aerobic carbon-monoxide dehydrogenase large subunit